MVNEFDYSLPNWLVELLLLLNSTLICMSDIVDVLPNKKGDAMLSDASIEFYVYTNVAVNNVDATLFGVASLGSVGENQCNTGLSSACRIPLWSRKSNLRGR